MSTFGPSFDGARDGERLRQQRGRILEYMLEVAALDQWVTVERISDDLEAQYRFRFPEPSVSAQLRHLRKQEFGSWDVRKRWCGDRRISEYRIYAPVRHEAEQLELPVGAR